MTYSFFNSKYEPQLADEELVYIFCVLEYRLLSSLNTLKNACM
jgi:hypothetical protein